MSQLFRKATPLAEIVAQLRRATALSYTRIPVPAIPPLHPDFFSFTRTRLNPPTRYSPFLGLKRYFINTYMDYFLIIGHGFPVHISMYHIIFALLLRPV
jgi:uncharacterized membrane protein YagU involved in acid resistance